VSTQGAQQGGTGGSGEPGGAEQSREARGQESGQPSEEEVRAAYEAELSRITSADMVLQATVSLLNIGAHRLGLVGGAGGAESATAQAGPERDLEQVRDAIDAVRGLMGVIERRAPQEARPLREALSQLQMAYAREAQAAPAAQGAPAAAPSAGAPPAGSAGGSDTTPAGQPSPGGEGGAGGSTTKPGPGPAESSGRLWVPGR
jgi:hypothetical protein